MQVKKEVPVEVAHFSRFLLSAMQSLGTFPAPNAWTFRLSLG